MQGLSLIPCPLCGRPVSAQASACPQCGQPLGGAAATRGAAGRGGGLVTLLLLASLGGLGFVIWSWYLPSGLKDGVLLLLRGGRRVVLDERLGVPPRDSVVRSITLAQECEVEVEIEVTLGDGVDVFVGDAGDLHAFRSARLGGWEHAPRHAAFAGRRVQRATKRGRLSAGEWFLVVENPTYGLRTRSTTFDVQVRVELRP